MKPTPLQKKTSPKVLLKLGLFLWSAFGIYIFGDFCWLMDMLSGRDCEAEEYVMANFGKGAVDLRSQMLLRQCKFESPCHENEDAVKTSNCGWQCNEAMKSGDDNGERDTFNVNYRAKEETLTFNRREVESMNNKSKEFSVSNASISSDDMSDPSCYDRTSGDSKMRSTKASKKSKAKDNLSNGGSKRTRSFGVSKDKKMKKQKVGEKISALQQLICPFGKTDTASVLQQVVRYVDFLQNQIKVLSSPYLEGSSTKETKSEKEGLRKRGLCLVDANLCAEHVSSMSNAADFWAPASSEKPS